jgi:cytochrome P450
MDASPPPACPFSGTGTGFDHHRFARAHEVYAAYRLMRAHGPVTYSSSHGGFYVLTGFDTVRAAARNHEVFSSATGHMLPEPGWPMVPPEDFDPPEHTRWRRIFQNVVSPEVRRRLEGRITRRVDAAIDTFAPLGRCDLYQELAEPIPALVVADLMGLDEHKAPEMQKRAVAMFDATNRPEDFTPAFDRFVEFLMVEVADRRQHPREDWVSLLSTGTFEGIRLTDDELVGSFVALFLAAHHSTASAMASLLCRVAAHPDLRDRLLADRSLVPRAVEETVRLDTPLHGFRRRTREATTVAGTDIPEDADVLLVYAAANRDPAKFAEPDTFDLERTPNPHLGFGFGIHTCVGAPVARMELRIALNRVLDRIPDLRIAGPAPEPAFVGGKLATITELHVEFTPVNV